MKNERLRNRNISMRLTEAEYVLLHLSAAKANKSLTDYIVHCVLKSSDDRILAIKSLLITAEKIKEDTARILLNIPGNNIGNPELHEFIGKLDIIMECLKKLVRIM